MPGEDFHLSVVAPLQAHSGGAAQPRCVRNGWRECKPQGRIGLAFTPPVPHADRPLRGRRRTSHS